MDEAQIRFSRRDFLKLSSKVLAPAVLLPKSILRLGIGETPAPTQEEMAFLQGHEVSFGDQKRKVILMTYDDGGTPQNITTILDAYKNTGGGKTTFFVMGDWLEKSAHKEIANRIVHEGHVLGCHGYHHDPFTTLSRGEMSEQFAKFTRVAGEVVPGYKVRFFRPPYGDRNQEVREEAARWGMQTAMWSMSSGGHDYTTYPRVVRAVDKGTIVLSHSTRYYDVNQAAKIVTGLADAGYSLESMDTGLDPNDYWKNASPLLPIQQENPLPEVADAKGRI